jgi:hypothetical protein
MGWRRRQLVDVISRAVIISPGAMGKTGMTGFHLPGRGRNLCALNR